MKNTFGENRFVFKEAAPTEAEAAKARAEAEGKTPEQLKTSLIAKVEALQDKIKAVTKEKNKYTEGLINEVTAISERLGKIKSRLDSFDIGTSATAAKTELLLFHDSLVSFEAPSDEALEENAGLRTDIDELRKMLEEKKAAVTPETIRTAILVAIGVTEPPVLVSAIEARLNLEALADDLSDRAEAITASLDNASLLPQADAVNTALDDAKKQLEHFDADYYVEELNAENIATIKNITSVAKTLAAVCEDGKFCSGAAQKMWEGLAEMIQGDQADALNEKVIQEEFGEDIAMARVADVIELQADDFEKAVEKIKGALRFYELGKHREHVEESAGAKDIIEKIMAAKKEGKLPDIKIDYMGGTDGTKHRLMKSETWHKEKADAFEKLLAFNAAGKLSGVTLTAEETTLITEYITAARGGKGYDFVKEPGHKDAFLKGGGLFDAALALQRAEDMKTRVEGEQAIWNVENLSTDTLHVERNATPRKKTDRKSSLKFSVTVKKPGAEDGIAGPYASDADPYASDADDDADPYANDADNDTDVVPTPGAEDKTPVKAPEESVSRYDIFELEGQSRLKITFAGETEPKYYTISKPEEISFTAENDEEEGSYIIATTKVGDKVYDGYFEIDKKDGNVMITVRGLWSDANNVIWDKYPVSLEGDTIKIEKIKPAPPSPPEVIVPPATPTMVTPPIDKKKGDKRTDTYQFYGNDRLDVIYHKDNQTRTFKIDKPLLIDLELANSLANNWVHVRTIPGAQEEEELMGYFQVVREGAGYRLVQSNYNKSKWIFNIWDYYVATLNRGVIKIRPQEVPKKATGFYTYVAFSDVDSTGDLVIAYDEGHDVAPTVKTFRIIDKRGVRIEVRNRVGARDYIIVSGEIDGKNYQGTFEVHRDGDKYTIKKGPVQGNDNKIWDRYNIRIKGETIVIE